MSLVRLAGISTVVGRAGRVSTDTKKRIINEEIEELLAGQYPDVNFVWVEGQFGIWDLDARPAFLGLTG